MFRCLSYTIIRGRIVVETCRNCFNVNFDIFFKNNSLVQQLVNKQNSDNTKTHGTNVKIVEVQQASLCNTYRNTKLELLNSCDFSKHKSMRSLMMV